MALEMREVVFTSYRRSPSQGTAGKRTAVAAFTVREEYGIMA